MTTYQIHIAVDVEADSEEAAMAIAENLEAFLGMHHETSTLGSTTEIIELADEEDAADEDFDNVVDNEDDLVDEYDPMDDVNYVGHPVHY